jgi:hypothetical protein
MTSEIERAQRFIRIVTTMPPEVERARLILMEWLAEQSNDK